MAKTSKLQIRVPFAQRTTMDSLTMSQIKTKLAQKGFFCFVFTLVEERFRILKGCFGFVFVE